MPLGLDDDELAASIDMYEFRLTRRTQTIYSLQTQISTKDSSLRPATRPLPRHDLLHARGEGQAAKQSQQLSAVEEEQPSSHFGWPVIDPPASPPPQVNIRHPGEGRVNTVYCNEEIQPRKLTYSTSLPAMPSRPHYCSTSDLQYQYMPARNTRRRGFSYADEFEKELRELDITHVGRPKGRPSTKSSYTRTQSGISSTSSSIPQLHKRGILFWKPNKDVHSPGSTSSTVNMEGDLDDQALATNFDAPPPYTETEKRASRLERLLKHLNGRDSDSVGSDTGGGASQHDSAHRAG
ncbi:hypothetical protein AYL99_04313 [Fonsecaea erecta]|uniref:Uncharacterized protein n=1 Tax=Fonsecaea erecta TaxID=1367422 RepID=A0A178ZQM5_9EURO|nr:hypothetical protein AYL99_04313 [Fonsecaea erecta]OAP62110.1 hypothetical protein AYL99_04313 [Fonsecaea erecta]